ncbi:ParB N-terminal domain-containing protein [Streptomyces sp. NBRC 110035]|uniref:ParB/RepB/Spo0J family partition protein n=1 Tax=Streptomyces sp. NBRC 110035 TaxID=1547867 RepID=UPI0005A7682D|nr:ParB N-terminal domain-containing protein [Streptomyces sp. NBRC 110035]
MSSEAEIQLDVLDEPTHMVPVDSLSIEDCPRLEGEDLQHTQLLLASETVLPPILVHRPTLRVIDGMHRLRVALLRGQSEIAVRFFDGSEADAFVLAVRSNAVHGLPLTLSDRTAAATRIVISHPHWSDRAVARVSGLSPKTVAAIRRRSTADTPPLNTRVGQDGRVRPISAAAGRERAGRLIAANPGIPLRAVAKEAGISVGTAHDVRERLASGRDPVPDRERRGAGARARGRTETNVQQLPARPVSPGVLRDRARNPAVLVHRLLKDPSLRSTETGRTLLRLLDAQAHVVQTWDRLVDGVPQHCSEIIADLANEYAKFWHEFAAQSHTVAHGGDRQISG